MDNTGERIKRQRKYKGVSQEKLADYVGISVMSIRRYEAMEREAPEDILNKIAEALGVTTAYLKTGENKDEVAFNARDIREVLDRDHVLSIDDLSSKHLKDFLKDCVSTSLPDPLESFRKNIERKFDKYASDYASSDDLLLEFYHQLNLHGRKEAIKRIHELTRLLEYTGQDDISNNSTNNKEINNLSLSTGITNEDKEFISFLLGLKDKENPIA